MWKLYICHLISLRFWEVSRGIWGKLTNFMGGSVSTVLSCLPIARPNKYFLFLQQRNLNKNRQIKPKKKTWTLASITYLRVIINAFESWEKNEKCSTNNNEVKCHIVWPISGYHRNSESRRNQLHFYFLKNRGEWKK